MLLLFLQLLALHALLVLPGTGLAYRMQVVQPGHERYALLPASLILSAAFWSLLGLLMWNLPSVPAVFWQIVGALSLIWALTRIPSRAHLRSWLRNCFAIPALFFLFFSLFLAAHFSPSEFSGGPASELLIQRTGAYPVIDHVLQWRISENFSTFAPIETSFNPDKRQLWSAGDRPLWIGFLDATLAKVFGMRGLQYYYLRCILLASFLFPSIGTVLVLWFRIRRRWLRQVLIASLVFHPFFLMNILYTWPKLIGAMFAVQAAVLLVLVSEQPAVMKQHWCWGLAGLGLSFACLCHASAWFFVLGLCCYAALQSWPWSLRGISMACLPVLIAVAVGVVPASIHSFYVRTHTNQTGLMARVNYCRTGSFSRPTRAMSLLKACQRYVHRVGWQGVLADRRESLRRAFFDGYQEFVGSSLSTLTGRLSGRQYLRHWFTQRLYQPVYTYGFLSTGVLLLFFLRRLFDRKVPSNLEQETARRAWALSVSGFLLLLLFAVLLGQYTEMRSHIIPAAIHLFIQLGTGLLLGILHSRLLAAWSCGSVAISLLLWTATPESVNVLYNPTAFLLGAAALLAALGSDSQPDDDALTV